MIKCVNTPKDRKHEAKGNCALVFDVNRCNFNNSLDIKQRIAMKSFWNTLYINKFLGMVWSDLVKYGVVGFGLV